jgi:hypothetical protein
LPEEKIKKYRYVAILIALILVGHFFYSEILKYINYSYALISENGEVIEEKNFNYEIIFKDDDSPEYIIVGLSNPKNLTLQPFEAVSSEFTETNEGVKIRFIATGWGNPVVTSKFKIELFK